MTDRTVTYRLRAELGQFRAQMAQAGAATKKLGDDLTSMDQSAVRNRQSLDQLGGTAGRVGLVAAAGLGATVLASAKFDQAMSNVQAATHETAGNMELLRQAALDAGQATAFSATEAAAGIEELSKAGVSTSDILAGGLTGALNLAAAGGIDVAEAAETAASAMTQFKLEGEDVGHVADLLSAAAGKAQGSVSDMGAALNQSGLVAAQTGLSIEETTGTLAAFASAGLTGSDAGTSFKQMLLSLNPNSAKARETMDQLGISAYDAGGNFVGMAAFADSLRAGLADLSTEQQNAALKTLFGSDAVRAASIVFENGSAGIERWTSNVDDAGYAAETAATRMDNLAGDWEEFTGSLETALIGTGSGAQGPLRSLVQGATDAVNAYNKLPEPIQTATAAATGLTAVIGGGAWFGSKVIQGVADTRQALSELGLTAGVTKGALGRMALTAGGIATLAAAVGALDEALAKASGARLDTSNLSRDLEAVSKGFDSEVLETIVGDIKNLDSSVLFVSEGFDEFTKGFGLFGDTMLDRAKDNLQEVDQQLAGLVESGNAEQAAAIFDRIAEGVGDRGLATDAFEAYGTALRNTGEAAGLLDPALEAITAGASSYSTQADQATKRTQRMTDALRETRGAARETALGFVDIGNAVETGKQSLGDFLRNMEDQAQALRQFSENAAKAGKRGLEEGLIEDLRNLGPEGARQMRLLANATDAEIRRANKAWQAGQTEVNAYTRQVGGVPRSVSTDVNVNANGALRIMDLVEQQMRYLDGLTSTTYVETVRRNRVSGGDQEYATGGYVSGPGTATSDSIPAMLSDGEFVMKAAAVDHYGPQIMHDINAMRFAEGGMAQRYAAPATSGGGVTVLPQSLDGVRVEGRIGADGYLRGIIRDEARSTARGEVTAEHRFQRRLDDRA